MDVNSSFFKDLMAINQTLQTVHTILMQSDGLWCVLGDRAAMTSVCGHPQGWSLWSLGCFE